MASTEIELESMSTKNTEQTGTSKDSEHTSDNGKECHKTLNRNRNMLIQHSIHSNKKDSRKKIQVVKKTSIQ